MPPEPGDAKRGPSGRKPADRPPPYPLTGADPGSGSDAALVRAVAAGSHDALAALYDRHADAVFASASRLTSDRGMAEEVVQETFLALWDRAETFDPSVGSLAAWLHTIARNRTVGSPECQNGARSAANAPMGARWRPSGRDLSL